MGTSPDVPNSDFTNACRGGCALGYSGGGVSGRGLQGGVYHYYANGTYTETGTACAGGKAAPSATPQIPAPSCGAGQTLGTVNGVPTCLDSGTGAPASPHAPAPPSKSTTTATPETTAPDGTKTKTETTVNPDGSTTTKTTTTAPNGTVTVKVEDKGKDPLDGFCKQNPTASICSKSRFGGSCVSGFTCDGDAAQCAVARELHTRDCTFFDGQSSERSLYEAIKAGADPLGASFPSPDRPQVVDVSNPIQQTAFIGNRALVDASVSLGPLGTLTVPWSRLTSTLELMGRLAVLFALLAAARIVFRS